MQLLILIIYFHSTGDSERQIIASAMNEYHKNTCIRFVPRTSETDYVNINKSGAGYYTIYV